MAIVYCVECSDRAGGYVRHPWPPCDLNHDGTAIDPMPCGHRRPWRDEDGSCRECRRKGEQ
jgi:hypothetical protein